MQPSTPEGSPRADLARAPPMGTSPRPSRYAAMINAGAAASRTRIAAQATADTPMPSTTYGSQPAVFMAPCYRKSPHFAIDHATAMMPSEMPRLPLVCAAALAFVFLAACGEEAPVAFTPGVASGDVRPEAAAP